ncbi:DUF2787 domain-containing protein [Vibrio sp. CK2-1]|uniref:DUF2787 domain-containing protein n=2 Tax=unclassified Vibrio TaxID=2614977 RepID=UPI001F3C0853|nr:DUF2787 domain-containing protein [Vibrio sp. CK2-1]MCF7355537.1 DUF2787 domain-containing protein [Vibrio sp. CK2-1]
MQTLSNLGIQPTIFPISKVLKSHLNERLSQYLQASNPAVLSPQTQSITFNFKDTSYTAEEGGFHPVEIMLKRTDSNQPWTLAYITDFAYLGRVYPELERCLDFDFQSGSCFLFPACYWQSLKNNKHASELYALWETAFLQYLEMDSYNQISVRLL